MRSGWTVVSCCLVLALPVAPPLFAGPGDYTEVAEDDWRGATLMAGLDGALWVIDSGGLYKVDKSGKWAEVGDGDWRGATLMAGLDGALWVIDSGGLYRISTR